MQTIAICDKRTLEVIFTYVADAPNQAGFGGPWGDRNYTVHIAVPDGTNVAEYSVSGVSGGFSLVMQADKTKTWQQNQNLLALNDYTVARSAQAELDIQAALLNGTGQNADYTTHLMIVGWATDVIQNPGNYTGTDLANATATLAAYRPLYPMVQSIRDRRDADIAAFVPPYPGVSPVYPS